MEDLVTARERDRLYNERMSALRTQITDIDLKSLEISEDDLYDKFCDPDKPMRIQFNDVSAAAYRIKGGVEITPCTVKE